MRGLGHLIRKVIGLRVQKVFRFRKKKDFLKLGFRLYSINRKERK